MRDSNKVACDGDSLGCCEVRKILGLKLIGKIQWEISKVFM
jgi:hypothetical protein